MTGPSRRWKVLHTSPGRGSHSAWCPIIEAAQAEYVPKLVDCGALTSAEGDDIQRRLAAAVALIPAVGPSRLLHGDLEGDHIFFDGHQFTGLVDFGSMQAGDPVYDLARYAWWDASDLKHLLDGYGHDGLTDEDLQIRMPAYLIANATRTVGEVTSNNPPAPRVRQFVQIACAVRFDRSDGRVTAMAPRPPSPQETLRLAVVGNSDEEIAAFAETVGGYGKLCGNVFSGLAQMLSPKADCTVGFVLGDSLGWVLRCVDGKVSVTKRVAKRAPAIARVSAPDLLRVICAELSWTEAIADGRLSVDGDIAHFKRMVGLEDTEQVTAELYGKSSRSTVLERYRRNADAFEALISSTPPDQWNAPSPCEGWTARDIVVHVVELTTQVATGVEPAPELAAYERCARRPLEHVAVWDLTIAVGWRRRTREWLPGYVGVGAAVPLSVIHRRLEGFARRALRRLGT